jgi:Putative adhesin
MNSPHSRKIISTNLAIAALAALALSATAGASETRIERNLVLQPGGKLELSTDVGAIEIRGGATAGARLVITAEREDFAELFDVQVRETPGQVTIEVERRDKGVWGWFGASFRGRVHFDIEVPAQTSIAASTAGGPVSLRGTSGDAHVSTSGGSIEARDLGGDLCAETSGGAVSAQRIAGDATLETSGGSIEATAIGGKLDARTSGGGIDISTVAGDILASTSGGGVSIEGAGGRVDAESSGGSVHVDFATGNAHGGDLESSGGPVSASLDPDIGLDVDANTSGGGVRCDLPITVRGALSRSHLRGTLNGGGPLLRLRSSGGGIRIEAR